MKFSRDDYNEQIFFGDAALERMGQEPDGEPCFILRARDYFAPILVRLYASMIADHPQADKRLQPTAMQTAVDMERYQAEVGFKFPDMPGIPERYDLHKMRSESLRALGVKLQNQSMEKINNEIKRKENDNTQKTDTKKDAGENITPLRGRKSTPRDVAKDEGSS